MHVLSVVPKIVVISSFVVRSNTWMQSSTAGSTVSMQQYPYCGSCVLHSLMFRLVALMHSVSVYSDQISSPDKQI